MSRTRISIITYIAMMIQRRSPKRLPRRFLRPCPEGGCGRANSSARGRSRTRSRHRDYLVRKVDTVIRQDEVQPPGSGYSLAVVFQERSHVVSIQGWDLCVMTNEDSISALTLDNVCVNR